MRSCSSPGPTCSTARIATSASTCPASSGCSSRRSRRQQDLRELASWSRRWLRWTHLVGDAWPFLGRRLAPPNTRRLMHEANRYLKNRDGVGAAVRGVLRSTLEAAWRDGDRVVLIGHSLGSVIAYDTLWELTHVHRAPGEVSLLVTLGSPLAHTVRAALAARCAGARRGSLSAQHPPLGQHDGARRYDGAAAALEAAISRDARSPPRRGDRGLRRLRQFLSRQPGASTRTSRTAISPNPSSPKSSAAGSNALNVVERGRRLESPMRAGYCGADSSCGSMMTSMRRLRSRPCSVSLLAIGCVSP